MTAWVGRPAERLRVRTRAWTLRRQGADGEHCLIERRRIYILPTRLGCVFALMVIAMLLGGLNYDNNLGLALAFLLGSIALVAMHHCHGNLLGLQLRLAAAQPAFAGQRVVFRVRLDNASAVARPRLVLGTDGDLEQVVDVPARGSAECELAVDAPSRGLVALRRFTLATGHPLGLFRAWSVVHPPWAAVAYPRPAARHDRPRGAESDTGGRQQGTQGEDDFAGLTPFQRGDPPSRVAWKTHARGLGLHTKQYAGTSVNSQVFDWDSLPQLDAEARLSQLCRWVVDAQARGEAFGLRLPGRLVPPNLGPAHRQQCLNALALLDTGDLRA